MHYLDYSIKADFFVRGRGHPIYTNVSGPTLTIRVSMKAAVASQRQRGSHYKIAIPKSEDPYVRPVDSLTLMRNAAKGTGVGSYTRRVADVGVQISPHHGSDRRHPFSNSNALNSERGLPRQPGPPRATAQPRKPNPPNVHRQRYERSLAHEVPDPWEQTRNRNVVPQAVTLPELVVRETLPSEPQKSKGAHVREAREEVHSDEISKTSPPPVPKEGRSTKTSGSRISAVKEYIYPSGKEPTPCIPNRAKICSHPDCPLNRRSRITHFEGPYYHRETPNPRLEVKIFGASNPPPYIWTSYDDCFVLGEGNAVGMKDLDNVIPFAFFHGFVDDEFVARFEVGTMSEAARAMRSKLRSAYKNQPKKKKKVAAN